MKSKTIKTKNPLRLEPERRIVDDSLWLIYLIASRYGDREQQQTIAALWQTYHTGYPLVEDEVDALIASWETKQFTPAEFKLIAAKFKEWQQLRH